MTYANRAAEYIRSCGTGMVGEYRFCQGGLVSLYASCYATMARHTIGNLDSLTPGERAAWCEYLNGWQDPETGYYLGPELAPDEFTRPELDEAYARLHLVAHVLPALDVLSGAPAHPLRFAHAWIDLGYLRTWLEARDWRRAWLEGNNLLFAGQLLVHLRDREQHPAAQQALQFYFDWLDAHQDPATGLWGTNGYCDLHEALYGAYHQLLVYFFCGRPVCHAAEIVDAVLSLQQADGSFSRTPGGGACEDVDAVHVLVNLAQRSGYRLADVRRALHLTMRHLFRQQGPDGGFVYRWGRSYMQSGLLRTFVPANAADLFSTWFRLHTLALISQVLDEPELKIVDWRFNPSCSMGWVGARHASPVPETPGGGRPRRVAATGGRSRSPSPLKSGLGRTARAALARLPVDRALAWARTLLGSYGRTLAPAEGLRFLGGLDAILDGLGRQTAYEMAGGLDVQFWGAETYRYLVQNLQPGMRVLHLGCGSGSLSYSLASQVGVSVTATDRDPELVVEAGRRYHHPQLAFVPADGVVAFAATPDIVVFTHLAAGKPAWARWSDVWQSYHGGLVLAQLTPGPLTWREAVGQGAPSSGLLAPARGPSLRSRATRRCGRSPDRATNGRNTVAALVPADWTLLEVHRTMATLFGHLRVARLSEGQEGSVGDLAQRAAG